VVVRVAIGLVFFVLAVAAAVAVVRLLANAPSEEERGPLEEVEDREIVFVCRSCGMEIRVIKRREGDSRPPRHCGEKMELLGATPDSP
jgi:hypothetical protein